MVCNLQSFFWWSVDEADRSDFFRDLLGVISGTQGCSFQWVCVPITKEGREESRRYGSWTILLAQV